jgi:hypothetical protein
VNPLVDGVRLAINDLDVFIPGGAFAKPPGKGWTVNASGTTRRVLTGLSWTTTL